MPTWNPWHGCHPISPGCAHCYVYRIDQSHQRDSSLVTLNSAIDYPLRRNRRGDYLLPAGSILYTCFSSDFFVEDADGWRPQAWQMMRARPDVGFILFTKRIHRFEVGLPRDWGDGYDNVSIGCTAENQACADARLPLFLQLPIRHRSIVCEPLLEQIDLSPYLAQGGIEQVDAGGESGAGARLCRYEWVLQLQRQCARYHVAFCYHQTGALLEKEGRVYRIPRAQQHLQAARAGIDLPAKSIPPTP